jgi:tripartite-type tricarboxylate transporter receptor subunit TctC
LTTKRSPQAPDVPSIAELSPGFDLAVIQGLTTRVGTPRAVVEKIAAEVAAIVKEPEVMAQSRPRESSRSAPDPTSTAQR